MAQMQNDRVPEATGAETRSAQTPGTPSLERQLQELFAARAQRLARDHPVTQKVITAALDVAEAVRDGKLAEQDVPQALRALRDQNKAAG